jgi:hypothetical protein
MKKLSYLIVLTLILGLVLTGCLLSNVGQVPATEQSGITYLTKDLSLADLVGLWHFDGDAFDSSEKGNHGSVYGDAEFIDGKFGKALSFDGIDDYVDCGNEASLRPSEGITVEAWVNYGEFSTGSGGYAAICEGYYYGNTGFMLYQATGSPYNRVSYYVIATDLGNPIGQSSKLLSTNTWYYLAMVYDGSHVTLYIDGAYDSSVATTGLINWAGTIRNLYIGSTYTAGGAKFKGIIDEVRICNRALTDTEIAYNYSLGDVGIDIKPGSDPNSINLGSNGVVPVAILSSENFDATTVDPSTVTLSGAGVKQKGNSGSLEDVNGDGSLDLVVQVCTYQFTLEAGATEAVLNAYTYTGLPLTGSDVIRIVQPK